MCDRYIPDHAIHPIAYIQTIDWRKADILNAEVEDQEKVSEAKIPVVHLKFHFCIEGNGVFANQYVTRSSEGSEGRGEV